MLRGILSKRILLVATLACAAVAAAILYQVIISPRRNLDRFLREVATVEVGKTKIEDWRKNLERAHLAHLDVRFSQRTASVGCTEENTLLQKLRIAPRTVAWCYVEFEDGVAYGIDATILALSPNPDWHDFFDRHVHVVIVGDGSEPCTAHYRAVHTTDSRGTVFMSPCVSPQDRTRAFALNTSCLTRIGGCKTVQSMLPQVFARP